MFELILSLRIGGLSTTCLHSRRWYISSRIILSDGWHRKQHGLFSSSMALARRSRLSFIELQSCVFELRLLGQTGGDEYFFTRFLACDLR